MAAFVDGLRRLGYVEGGNVDIDYRYAAGDVAQLKPLAQELTVLKPDVMVGRAAAASVPSYPRELAAAVTVIARVVMVPVVSLANVTV